MKKLLLSAALLAGVTALNAQTPVGTVVSNFTLTDLNGNTHSLFDYTDAGKFVVIDVSATWCSPCWSYHNTGALNDFYNLHGPAGDNVAMVFFIEGDTGTNTACLSGSAGCNDQTQGDWVTGENMPIIDLATRASFENSGLSIAYFPVMYVICPNRTVLASGNAGSIGTLTKLNSYIGDCPAPASQSNDPALLSYRGETKDCKPMDLVVRLQNNGIDPLTACTITATMGATTIATYNWTGNLAKYGAQDVTVGTYLPNSSADNLTFTITNADNNAANNVVTQVVSKAGVGASNNVTIKVTTDRYGAETKWKIKRSNGTVAYTGPTYTNQSSNGSFPQPDLDIILPDDCYMLEVTDTPYGDGFDGSYGNGFIQVWVNGVQMGGVLNFTGALAKFPFQLEAVAGLSEITGTEFSVYPNPASDKLNITFEAENSDYQIGIMDLQGRVVASQNLQSLSGAQTVEFEVSDLAKGSYIVTVTTNGLTKTQNVVIK